MNESEMLKKTIVNFCNNYVYIYIYGAGARAKKLYTILKALKIDFQGFIVTEENKKTYLGKAVYTIREVQDDLDNTVGIISGFKGGDERTLRSFVGKMPGILYLEKLNFVTFLYYSALLPIVEKVSAKYPAGEMVPCNKWRNVLVVRLDVLGDLIMTSAFLRELRANLLALSTRITLVVRRSNAGLFANCPYIDDLCLYDPLDADPLTVQTLRGQEILHHVENYISTSVIGHKKYDVAIQPQILLDGRSFLENYMVAFASGARCQVGRINVLRDEYKCLAKLVKPYMSFLAVEKEEKHEVDYMLDLLRALGLKVKNNHLETWWNKKNISCDVKNFLASTAYTGDKFILFCLTGSIETKNWPPEKYGELARKIFSMYKFAKIIIVGDRNASSTAEKVKEIADSEKIIDFTGKTTLNDVGVILKSCQLYVGADTGIMHMAAAQGVPVVEISTALPGCTAATDVAPQRMGPYGVPSQVVMAEKPLDDCRNACYKNFPHCIKQISVTRVLTAIVSFMGEGLSAENNNWHNNI